MTGTVYVKTYRSPQRAAAARAHRDWLEGLQCDTRLPALHAAEPHQLVFEHLGHQQPGPHDLPLLAQALGNMHAAAYTQQLHTARLDEPFPAPCGLVIVDFVTPRRQALQRMPLPLAGEPVAFYKDANIRNFLLTDDGVAVIDFDDLTLAPFGYDLAKLVVSTAMTHGHLNPHDVELALSIYNANTAMAGPACSMQQLRNYAEFHHLLTVRYLHRNGYRNSWPEVRPWQQLALPR